MQERSFLHAGNLHDLMQALLRFHPVKQRMYIVADITHYMLFVEPQCFLKALQNKQLLLGWSTDKVLTLPTWTNVPSGTRQHINDTPLPICQAGVTGLVIAPAEIAAECDARDYRHRHRWEGVIDCAMDRQLQLATVHQFKGFSGMETMLTFIRGDTNNHSELVNELHSMLAALVCVNLDPKVCQPITGAFVKHWVNSCVSSMVVTSVPLCFGWGDGLPVVPYHMIQHVQKKRSCANLPDVLTQMLNQHGMSVDSFMPCSGRLSGQHTLQVYNNAVAAGKIKPVLAGLIH